MKLRKTILGALLVVCNSLSAQTTENYIETRQAKVPRTSVLSTNNDENQVTVSTQFFDGLGRPKQTVLWRASPNRKDIVRAIEYDDYGRQSRSYLPYEASFGGSGTFRSDWKSRLKNFYHYADNSVADETNFFYSENVYEPSPLNRIAQSYGRGSDWRVSGSEKPVAYSYRPNITSDAIKVITIDNITDSIAASGTSYDPGELWVTETTDENGNKMLEFKNKLDQVIRKKAQLTSTTYTSTYYVYDDFGNLRYVLPPATFSNNSDIIMSHGGSRNAERFYFKLEEEKTLQIAFGGSIGTSGSFDVYKYYQSGNDLYHFSSQEVPAKSGEFVLPAGEYELEVTLSDGGFNLNEKDYTVTQGLLDQYAFQYKYDGRKRMIEKKVPGAAPIYMIYDQRDRLVLTQDGNQRSAGFETLNGNVSKNTPPTTNYYVASGSLTLQPGFHASGTFTATSDVNSLSDGKWIFTKYDALNRPVMTGITTINGTRQEIQDDINLDASNGNYEYIDTYVGDLAGNIFGYDNNAYPDIEEDEVLSVNYYDNHNFLSLSNWFGVAGPNNPYNYTGTITQNTKLKGLTTGGLTKVLGTQNMLPSVTYYDSRYRPIQNISGNHLGGTEKITTKYFNVVSPNVESVSRIHKAGTVTKTIQEEYTYDHMDRLLTTKTTIDGNPSPSTITHSYNEIGELIKKDLNGIQEVDYQYNIRGWLTKINNGTALTGSDVFGMELKYTDAPAGYEQYNGNIGQILWKGVDESTSTNDNAQDYKYKYDPLNRLKKAEHTSGSNLGYYDVGGNDAGQIRYDANGNTKSLTRKYNNDLMDNLTYSYAHGNQLSAVADAVPDAGRGFEEIGSEGMQADEYLYDANGNMVKDANKKIANIQYNHLNLPEQVNYLDENDILQIINYTYTASGVKLRKETGSGPTIDYLGGIQYKGGTLDFVQHPEGRYKFGTSSGYEYDLKDHLGNVRSTVKGTVNNISLYTNTNTQQGSTISFINGDIETGDDITLSFEAKSGGVGIVVEVYALDISGDYQYELFQDSYGSGSNFHSFFYNFKLIRPNINEIHILIHDENGSQMTVKNIILAKASVNLAVVQRDDYYPFGLTFNSYATSPENLYKYNGKEEQKEWGVFDYEARFYDPALGRWGVVDPKASLFYAYSPYNYVGNNPIRRVDPTGETGWDVVLGAAAAFVDNAAGGFTNLRSTASNYVTDASDFNKGQDYGDAASIGVGLGMAEGGSGTATGAALVTVGSGGFAAPGSVPVAVVGAAVAAEGVILSASGAKNLASQKDRMDTGAKEPVTNDVYKRPNNATNKAQRESVQGKPCVDCGATGQKNVADHKTPLVKEHYQTGGIDKANMKSTEAVQPQCQNCSNKQGGEMSGYSKQMKKEIQTRTQ